MPPRVLLSCPFGTFLGSANVHNPLISLARQPCKSTIRAGSVEARERRRHDPFLMAQSRQRKAANISRQQGLREEREAALGDPVKSRPTPFIQSIQPARSIQGTPIQDGGSASSGALNHFIDQTELQNSLEYSKELTTPAKASNPDTVDPQIAAEELARHLELHRNALEAMSRILNLSNGNSKDRMRVNIQKCIESFGRHNTDSALPSKPVAAVQGSHSEKAPRAGPDTGSSEVQVAILTTKILNLSKHLEGTRKDKHNKRNLRILVHKRQKLLRYLRRKERGGPRWQNLVESLGLSDAAWKGEISL